MGELDGQVALITGAAMGMGAATARRFSEEGAAVVVADRDEDGAHHVAEQLVAAGGQAMAVCVDVAVEAQVARAVATAVATYGRLDGAVNNAALRPDHRPVVEIDLEEFDGIVTVNLRGVLACMKYEAQQMVAQGAGAIVNIGSTSSARPQPGASAYVAAKHGVIGLTRTASTELAPRGVRVNAVCPGATRTPMLEQAMARRGVSEAEHAGRLSQLGRFAEPEEVAEASVWLCSRRSSFVTGHALAVDGGYTAW